VFGSILIFILVLSVLVIVHEAGHFFMAKRAGLLVEEFGFGIPPRIFGKKIGETIYSLNLFPFGGFVRLNGENSEEGVTDPKRAFITQSKKTRVSIIVAGVLMNFILAIVAFAAVYTVTGVPKDTNDVKVIEVAKGTPAETAGFLVDDVIVKINGKSVADNKGFIEAVKEVSDKEVVFLVKRGSEEKELKATPRSNPPEGEGALGVVISTVSIYFPPIWQRPFVGVFYGFKEAIFWTQMIAVGLFGMIAGLFRGVVPKDVAGPVGIYALTSQAASYGIMSLINFMGVLSVNLAILNILPFPALDGGRLLFIFLEKIIGRKVLPKVESIIHMAGMAILMLLLFAITFSDIKHLIAAGGVAGFLENLVK